LSTDLTEGDVLCVMSQWGEVDDINLPREQAENKSQGTCTGFEENFKV